MAIEVKGKIQILSFLEPIFGYLEEVSVNSLYFNSKLQFALFQSNVRCAQRVNIGSMRQLIIFHLIMKIYYDLINSKR